MHAFPRWSARHYTQVSGQGRAQVCSLLPQAGEGPGMRVFLVLATVIDVQTPSPQPSPACGRGLHAVFSHRPECVVVSKDVYNDERWSVGTIKFFHRRGAEKNETSASLR